MELTWIAIIASLCMGGSAACLFVFAVRKDWFRNIEDAKYQVFWSDVEQLVNTSQQQQKQQPPRTQGASNANESETN